MRQQRHAQDGLVAARHDAGNIFKGFFRAGVARQNGNLFVEDTAHNRLAEMDFLR